MDVFLGFIYLGLMLITVVLLGYIGAVLGAAIGGTPGALVGAVTGGIFGIAALIACFRR